MEQWKTSIIIGVVLIILGLIFAAIRKEINIWIILIIVLAIIDIVLGLVRKNR